MHRAVLHPSTPNIHTIASYLNKKYTRTRISTGDLANSLPLSSIAHKPKLESQRCYFSRCIRQEAAPYGTAAVCPACIGGFGAGKGAMTPKMPKVGLFALHMQ